MTLAFKATASLCTLVICAGLNAAAASGVGDSGTGSGTHNSGGVGIGSSITVNDPLPTINVEGISLGQNSPTHNPSPNIPMMDLGQNDVQHRASVPIPSLGYGMETPKHGGGINIPIQLPNLNINISGMMSNVTSGGGQHNSGGGGGCRSRCGGGNRSRERNITINNSVHNETNIENNVFVRGGSTYHIVEDRTPVYIENFTIDGEVLAHEGLIPLRAVCLDSSGGVHPASQVFAEEMVSENFDGEIYRCVIGTYMQFTMGEMENGERSFEHAWSETCAVGDALRYRDGELTCARQEERRPCNERSLLRRHGPGEKLVVLRGMAMNGSEALGSLGLDGGVGAYRRF